MGLTYIEGTVRGAAGGEVTLDFLVDSGATYTLLPFDVWNRLSLLPKHSVWLRLADGTRVEREVSECFIRLPQGEGHTPVLLGLPGDDIPILGVVTLEVLGFVLNPVTRELQKIRAML